MYVERKCRFFSHLDITHPSFCIHIRLSGHCMQTYTYGHIPKEKLNIGVIISYLKGVVISKALKLNGYISVRIHHTLEDSKETHGKILLRTVELGGF
jgi:hypothetical protein